MKYIPLVLAGAVLLQSHIDLAAQPKVSSGLIERIEAFPSGYVDPRNVDVWLPEGYNDSRKYAVIYMHDGQMLFDSTGTWNKQEWQVDEVLTGLRKESGLQECIAVGIWNNGEARKAEYFPEAILDSIPAEYRRWVTQGLLKGKPRGDDYLSFVVMELKPYIESHYSTLTGPEHTFIMGSSRGGLISLYALCEFPGVFGGAACLSIHWPIVEPMSDDAQSVEVFSSAFRSYLKTRLPPAGERKIYYDIGTRNLDSYYGQHQALVDSLMTARGFSSEQWISRTFVGADHTERSWARRLSVPLEFLLRKE